MDLIGDKMYDSSLHFDRDVCKIWKLFNLVSDWMKTVGLFVSISKSKKKKK